jgi:hypothetical protein
MLTFNNYFCSGIKQLQQHQGVRYSGCPFALLVVIHYLCTNTRQPANQLLM